VVHHAGIYCATTRRKVFDMQRLELPPSVIRALAKVRPIFAPQPKALKIVIEALPPPSDMDKRLGVVYALALKRARETKVATAQDHSIINASSSATCNDTATLTDTLPNSATADQ